MLRPLLDGLLHVGLGLVHWDRCHLAAASEDLKTGIDLSQQTGARALQVIVGVLWAPWHVQYWPGGPVFMRTRDVRRVLHARDLSLSIMAYATLAEHDFNVVGATLFHVAINLTSALTVSL